MADERAERRLAAILVADVVGYSSLIRADEEGTRSAVRQHNTLTIEPQVAAHRGRIFKTVGDGLLAEFASVVDAVRCAIEIQNAIKDQNADVVAEKRVEFRIGVNLGDVIAEGDDLHGDGVNVAARLEGLAEPQGICISGSAFEQVRDKLEVGFEDLGDQQVKNIDRPIRAYRIQMDAVTPGRVVVAMSAKLQRWKWPAATVIVALVALLVAGHFGVFPIRLQSHNVERASVERMAHPLPAKPSIAVLPFENLSDQPQGELLADGVTETITATLGQVPGLFVISRNSAFTYKGKTVKAETVSSELGVRYVLEGSVQRAENRVRITAQLIDATVDQHLWADRYDRDLTDIFALQDEIALKVLVALQVKVTEGEQANARSHPTENLEAYLLYVRAMAAFRTFGKNGMINTRKLVDQSLAIDPENASALILNAWTYVIDARFRFSRPREESLTKADHFLEKAESQGKQLTDGLRAELLMARGFINLIEGKHEKAVALGSKAVALAPNNAFLVAVNGLILFFVRQYDNSIEFFQRAMRLSPGHPSWYAPWVSIAYVFKDDHSRAISVIEASSRRAESNLMKAAHRVRAAFAYADQGQIQKAQQEIERAKELASYLSVRFYRNMMHFEHEADWERFACAMRKAGLPE